MNFTFCYDASYRNNEIKKKEALSDAKFFFKQMKILKLQEYLRILIVSFNKSILPVTSTHLKHLTDEC
jgi:hypothetical protein